MLTTSRRVIACGALVIVTLIPAAAQPAATSRAAVVLETLRFTTPVALPGVTLSPGDYTFEVERHDHLELVRVREGRTDRIVFGGPARSADRPRGLKTNKSIVFGDAAPNRPLPIVAWFPRGQVVGYEFDHPARGK
jgi:hypothetical protein